MDKDKPFLMPIEDVFYIKGRGIVVTGRIQHGIVREGDEIEIGYPGGQFIKTIIVSIEVFGVIDYAEKGDNVGILLHNVELDQIKPGMLIAAPGLLADLDQSEE
jgi:elongation factor Tu